MKILIALAAVLTSALLTVPTVSQAGETHAVVASAQAEARNALA